MGRARKVVLLLFSLLIGIACTTTSGSPTGKDFELCKNTVKEWASSSVHLDVKEDKYILQDLLFFLHVPRTGGRAYLYCFLKKLYPDSLECPRSYDRLRFNPSKPDCRLLASHDDYSVMSKLPRDKTSVVTILRNPIDRVFSSYEFSVEVAARFLIHPNLTSATRMPGRLRSKNNKGLSTLEIWPWKYLVPWMREDLFSRRESGKLKVSTHRSNDSYNMKDIVMPLREYIHHPIALDVVHNGATFQVAGLTNNSNSGESHKVRHCVIKYQILGKYVLEVAKKRLDNMLYVGLTENHKESATMFADFVGAQVISQLMVSNSSLELAADNNSAQQMSSFSDSESKMSLYSNSSSHRKAKERISFTEKVDATNKTMTVERLTKAYESCISGLRNTQFERRNVSLSRISVNFTKEARLGVADDVLQAIASLNSLDMQLYKHAQKIFAKQRRQMLQKVVGSHNVQERQQSKLKYSHETGTWRFILLPSVLFLLFSIYLVVRARRRRSKLKL